MRRELLKYKGQVVEVVTFESEIALGSGKEIEQIDAVLKEEANTKSGKQKIKPLDKRRKPIEIK